MKRACTTHSIHHPRQTAIHPSTRHISPPTEAASANIGFVQARVQCLFEVLRSIIYIRVCRQFSAPQTAPDTKPKNVSGNNMTTDYIKYYDLENYVLTDVRDNFYRNGHLTAFDFFCIVIWKANRAKTKIAQRLLNYNSDIEQSVKDLTSKISSATDDKQKLKVLIDDYKFRLPMSSAILSLLYPDNFTIYDVRVCDTLTKFQGLDTITNFEKLWLGYTDYIDSVKNFEPQNLSLRDKDRFLWGKSFYEQLDRDIKNKFQK